MSFNTVIDASGVAQIVLENPPVNAFDSEGWASIAAEFVSLGANPEVRVIIVRAEGKGFCAGVDIKELASYPERIVQVNKGNYDTFAAVHQCPVPVIAAVHGYVLGGGIGICGAADIIIASDCATFGVPEVDRGALGAGGHLARMFPLQKVRYMYFTGNMIDAAEAYRLGAVERVVSKDDLAASAQEIADSIASKSPRVIALAKESLNGIEPLDLERNYRYEQGFTLEMYNSPDSDEARSAFVEKRDAKFTDKR